MAQDHEASAPGIWDGDLLARRKDDAVFLMRALQGRFERSNDADDSTGVVALRGDWGSGKTWFLKRFQKELQAEQHPVVYFDAWAADFSEDPLIAFIAAIEQDLRPLAESVPQVKAKLKEATRVGKRLFKPLLRIGAEVAVRHLLRVTTDEMAEMGKADSSGDSLLDVEQLSGVAEAIFSQHEERVQTIERFKESLRGLVVQLEESSKLRLPLFVLVDELDRCRPPYAIATLEAIKHLFRVQGVYFVVATHSEQLAHSIRAVYGQEFAAGLYLKRFFDREYTLPQASQSDFVSAKLCRCLETRRDRTPIGEDGSKPIERLVSTFDAISRMLKLQLRDVEQVCDTVGDVLANWPAGEVCHFPYLAYLAMLQHVKPEMFHVRLRDPERGRCRVASEIAAVVGNAEGYLVPLFTADFERNFHTPGEVFDRVASLEEIVSAFDNLATLTQRDFDSTEVRGLSVQARVHRQVSGGGGHELLRRYVHRLAFATQMIGRD